MGDAQPPLAPPPPPPHPPPPPQLVPLPHHTSRSTMPMLYYGLLVLATAGVVLAMYNLILIKWCSEHRRSAGRRRAAQLVDVAVEGNSGNFGQTVRASSFPASFKYVKGVLFREKGSEGEGELECAVCLSVFEEGDEVRQLPRCMHCFHVGCIDMWLYSHSDCPLCRSLVHAPPLLSRLRSMPDNDSEHSREGLLVPAAPPGVPNP
ncbi:hypothetical protein MLD38_014744 [Melastoma candidum]|uniref:Uncharacterized protein n=1 Tax=Melastoma candidum TaxID=119954 RepID=A0ACB9RDP6_9MYRT|nr:hypothetical protein MLD38_014744 [Melastoma candidum]